MYFECFGEKKSLKGSWEGKIFQGQVNDGTLLFLYSIFLDGENIVSIFCEFVVKWQFYKEKWLEKSNFLKGTFSFNSSILKTTFMTKNAYLFARSSTFDELFLSYSYKVFVLLKAVFSFGACMLPNLLFISLIIQYSLYRYFIWAYCTLHLCIHDSFCISFVQHIWSKDI